MSCLRLPQVACVLAAIHGVACGPDRVELPTPPLEAETAAIAAVYDAPTGTVPVARLQELQVELQMRLDALGLDWLPELVANALTGLRARADDNSLPADPAATEDEDRARLRAVLRLNRVCRGWAEPVGPPDAVANGSIEVTAIVEDGRLHPQLWGVAAGCRSRLTVVENGAVGPLTVNAFLSGTLIVVLYGPLPRAVSEADFLLRFEGEIGREERMAALSFDFRLIDGRIELRHAVADGDIIVGIGAGTFTLRGQNGTFTCELATLSCV